MANGRQPAEAGWIQRLKWAIETRLNRWFPKTAYNQEPRFFRMLLSKRVQNFTQWIQDPLHKKWQRLRENPKMPKMVDDGVAWIQRRWDALPERVRQWGNNITNSINDFDFKHFDTLKWPLKSNINLANPPEGLLLYMLFPATLGIRLLQAYNSAPVDPATGKKDLHHFKNVFRRDSLAFTLFFFGLKPFRILLTDLAEKGTEIPLTKITRGKLQEIPLKVLADNYDMHHSENIVVNLLRVKEKGYSWRGIRKAMDATLPTHRGIPEYKKYKTEFKGVMEELMTHLDTMAKDYKIQGKTLGLEHYQAVMENGRTRSLAERAMGILDQYHHRFEAQLAAEDKAMVSSMWARVKTGLNRFARLEANPRGFLGRYLQLRSLPVNIASFAFLAGLIGAWPILVNHWANGEAQHEAEDATHGNPHSLDVLSRPAPLSRLPQGGVLPVYGPSAGTDPNSYPARPWSSRVALNPYIPSKL